MPVKGFLWDTFAENARADFRVGSLLPMVSFVLFTGFCPVGSMCANPADVLLSCGAVLRLRYAAILFRMKNPRRNTDAAVL